MAEAVAVDPAFVPAELYMDSRFVNNTGGNMSNMVSRAIYELVEAEGTGAPSLNLEIYHKDNE